MGILVDFMYNKNPKMIQQLDRVFKKGIPMMIILGQNELDTCTVKLKYIFENAELTVPLNELEMKIKFYL